MAEGPVRVSHHTYLHLSPQFIPRFGDIPFFRAIHGRFAAQQAPHLLDILLGVVLIVVLMGDVGKGHLLQFFLGILQHGSESSVYPDKTKRPVEHRHPGRAFLEHPPETILALPQRLGHLIPLLIKPDALMSPDPADARTRADQQKAHEQDGQPQSLAQRRIHFGGVHARHQKPR